MQRFRGLLLTAGVWSLLAGAGVQIAAAQAPPPVGPRAAAPTPDAPADYLIGPGDILEVKFWGHENMSSTVVVRPDGRISLPLINEFAAAGLTPDQLRAAVTAAGSELLKEAPASVVVKEIHSRQVFITGMVGAPGSYPLGSGMRVLQLIASAGGLNEYADKKKISVIRQEGVHQVRYAFNHDDIKNGRDLDQNIALKPGDTVLVP